MLFQKNEQKSNNESFGDACIESYLVTFIYLLESFDTQFLHQQNKTC